MKIYQEKDKPKKELAVALAQQGKYVDVQLVDSETGARVAVLFSIRDTEIVKYPSCLDAICRKGYDVPEGWEFDDNGAVIMGKLCKQGIGMSIEKALEQIEIERWSAVEANDHVDSRNAGFMHNCAITRIKSSLEAPRVMLPYTEDCRPKESGWYWLAATAKSNVIITPAYFHDESDAWYDSDTGNDPFLKPKYWLPLEPTPVLPKQ